MYTRCNHRAPVRAPGAERWCGAGREPRNALAGRLEPVVHESLVRRREDALDELERRDPVGFARWLAAGPVPGSDPADWLGADSAGSPGAA